MAQSRVRKTKGSGSSSAAETVAEVVVAKEETVAAEDVLQRTKDILDIIDEVIAETDADLAINFVQRGGE